MSSWIYQHWILSIGLAIIAINIIVVLWMVIHDIINAPLIEDDDETKKNPTQEN